MKSILAILAVLALPGCAPNPYADYRAIHEANAKAQEARYRAFAEISTSGGDAVKVGAMTHGRRSTWSWPRWRRAHGRCPRGTRILRLICRRWCGLRRVRVRCVRSSETLVYDGGNIATVNS